MSFFKQFIGKWTLTAFVAIAALHLVAFLVRDTGFELIVLLFVVLIVAVMSWRSLENGLFIGFAEIFIGGHGHLLDADVFGFGVSLRTAIFGTVMLVWFMQLVLRRVQPTFIGLRDVPWMILLAAIAVGTIVGFTNNETAEAFDDMNGYLTMLYLLPIISIDWNVKMKKALLEVFAVSVIWMALFTLLLSFLFTHLDGLTSRHLYEFVRDTRLAEITLQTISDSSGKVVSPLLAPFFGRTGYWYRIFMPSQFFVVTALLLISSSFFFLKKEILDWRKVVSIMAILVSTAVLSLSRSFFLGLLASGFILVGLFIWMQREKISRVARGFGQLAVSLVLGLVILWITVVFPIPPSPDLSSASFYSGAADSRRDLAVSSRWQLIGPMTEEIFSSPLLGSGFGKEVTFISNDPRVRAEIPSGEWTSYRFEWGYQDIWLKMGVLGLLAFTVIGYSFARATWFSVKKPEKSWLIFGLSSGIILLYVSHIFTPFLNHPIGIGYLLFAIPFMTWTDEDSAEKVSTNGEAVKIIKPEMQPAMRVGALKDTSAT